MLQLRKEELEKIETEGVLQLKGLAAPVLKRRKELYQRYTRKRNPLAIMGAPGPEEQRGIPFEYYIATIVQGYLGGKAPLYRVSKRSGDNVPGWLQPDEEAGGMSDEEYVQQYTDVIDYIRRYNDDGATFTELIHDYIITGAAYLYIYQNQAKEIVYTRSDALQTVAIYDYSSPANQIGSLRVWEQAGLDSIARPYMELILPRGARFVKRLYTDEGDGLALKEEIPIYWEDIPFVSFEQPDGIAVFEAAIQPIDLYEQLLNNLANMTKYNDRDAKLLIRGYGDAPPSGTLDRSRLDRELQQAYTIFVGEGGEVEWLLKQVDYGGALEVSRNLHDLITMLTGVPNLTDEAFSNADNASALGYKLYALDQYSAVADRVFRKGYLRLWEIITARLNQLADPLNRGKKVFDFRDVSVVMQRNIPTDRDKNIERAVKLKQSQLTSHQTALDEAGLELDALEELGRLEEEEAREFNQVTARNGDLMEGVLNG